MAPIVARLIRASIQRVATPMAMVLVLVIAVLAGDCAPVSTIRGETTELGRTTARIGYYEALTDLTEPSSPRRPPDGWTAFGAAEAGIVEEIPSYLRWRMKPDLDLRWNGAVFRTNHLGWRSAPVSETKPEGTYRIVVLGSSNTMGYGVSNDEMYPTLLERSLNARSGGSGRIEVVNLAVSGDSPSRRLFRLQRDVERLDPDWVLCDVSMFDPFLEDRHIHAAVERGLPIPFAFVQRAIERTGVSPIDNFSGFQQRFGDESEGMFDDVCAGWAAEAKRQGVPFTLVILPRSDRKDHSARLHRYMLSVIRRHGIDFMDLSNAFDALALEQFRLSDWDPHPSPLGHRVIFEAIEDQLEKRGSLPGTSAVR